MDGVIGWLTLFGARCRDAVRDVLLYDVTSKLQITALAIVCLDLESSFI